MIQTPLPEPLTDSRFGLIAWGRSAVEFHDFRIQTERPQAFVVMQFGEQYDALYGDVSAPICSELGFEARRADDVFGPGIVLEDIISGLREAAVVIAEISPVNANVFYELGYAHAISKPTILLAQKGQPLPFDVQGYRCIFYNDLGGDYFQRRDPDRTTKRLIAQLQRLGHTVTLEKAAA